VATDLHDLTHISIDDSNSADFPSHTGSSSVPAPENKVSELCGNWIDGTMINFVDFDFAETSDVLIVPSQRTRSSFAAEATGLSRKAVIEGRQLELNLRSYHERHDLDLFEKATELHTCPPIHALWQLCVLIAVSIHERNRHC
jgi:hypothetical protein